MFIRSSTALNDCLIALDSIAGISIIDEKEITITSKIDKYIPHRWLYSSQEARDKAFDEMCAFLNKNYKLRDFT